ncbi:MAG: hypothetical protein E7037_01670 [Verrucomicrobia bacterium]|nr:hypothetical protein [Verrucomicrobiota bacterium]
MWIELTKARVIPRMSPKEYQAILTFDKDTHEPGQDLLQEIIDAVLAEMRAAIAACEKNTLDPNPSRIPHSLLNDAISMVAYHVGTRVGMPIEASKDPRYNAWIKARDTLDKLRTCAIPVENPGTGAVSNAANNGASVAIGGCTRMDRRNWRF